MRSPLLSIRMPTIEWGSRDGGGCGSSGGPGGEITRHRLGRRRKTLACGKGYGSDENGAAPPPPHRSCSTTGKRAPESNWFNSQHSGGIGLSASVSNGPSRVSARLAVAGSSIATFQVLCAAGFTLPFASNIDNVFSVAFQKIVDPGPINPEAALDKFDFMIGAIEQREAQLVWLEA